MYFSVNKKRYYYSLDWQSFASLDVQQIKDALINENNPYYVQIKFNNENGVLGYISSNSNISKQNCIAAALINYAASDITDSFVFIQKIPNKKGYYYVLHFEDGQVEKDDLLNEGDVVGFVRDINERSLKLYVSSDLYSKFDGTSQVEQLNIFDSGSILLNSKSKLVALSNTGNYFKLTFKILILLFGLYYFATEIGGIFNKKKTTHQGPSPAELAKIKNEEVRRKQVIYIDEQISKRTGGIGSVRAFKECHASIKSMPVSIAGWRTGTYSCNRAGDYKQLIQSSSMNIARIPYSLYPNDIKGVVTKLGLQSSVGFDETKRNYIGIVTKQIKTIFQEREELALKDLVGYKSLMDVIHFGMIKASDNRCSISWQKKKLGPLNPQEPLPQDLTVYFTNFDITCDYIYINKLVEQLNVFNRKDVNFVFMSLDTKSVKTRFQLITKG